MRSYTVLFKKVLSIIFCLLLTVLSPLSLAAKKPSWFKIQYWKTDNGVKVYFVQRYEVPMLDAEVVFAAGSSYDKKKWGVAYLTSQMLAEGTKTSSANVISEKFDGVGALYGASADRDMAGCSLRTVVRDGFLDQALANYVDVLSHPAFSEKALARVKNQQLDQIKIQLQDPMKIASDRFSQTIYKGLPYGHPTLGTLQSVSSLTRDDVAAFYKRYYVAANAKIILVGDLTLDKAKTIANEIASQLPQGKPAEKLALAPRDQKGQKVFVNFPAKQNAILLGMVGITRRYPGYYSLVVGNHVLGGLPMSSLLFEKVRNERGLTYSVYSYFMPLKLRGPFLISLQTRSTQAKKAEDVTVDVLKDFLQNGPTEKQLKAAKQNILGSFPIRLSTNKSVIGNVVNIAFYNLPLDYLDAYPEHVKKVTVASVKKAFANTVHLSQLTRVEVGVKAGAGNHG